MRITSVNFQSSNIDYICKECQNRMKMTEFCQLEGRVLKWQLAYFGLKVGYFGHIFKDINFKVQICFAHPITLILIGKLN